VNTVDVVAFTPLRASVLYGHQAGGDPRQNRIVANPPNVFRATSGVIDSDDRPAVARAKTVRTFALSIAKPMRAPAAAPIGTVIVDHWTRQAPQDSAPSLRP
jgi:hypothetical protein